MTLVFPRADDIGLDDIVFGDNAEFIMVNRELTELYIKENPVELTLVPYVRTRTATGGYVIAAGTPRASQKMRLIETSSVAVTDPQRTETGYQRVRMWQLMASYDAVIEIDDVFVLDGTTWKIISNMPKNGYERRAVIERLEPIDA